MKTNKLIKTLIAVVTLGTATAPVMAVDVVTPTFRSNFVDGLSYSMELVPSFLSFMSRQSWLGTVTAGGLTVAAITAMGYELYDYMSSVTHNNNKVTNFRTWVVSGLAKVGLASLFIGCGKYYGYSQGLSAGLAQMAAQKAIIDPLLH